MQHIVSHGDMSGSSRGIWPGSCCETRAGSWVRIRSLPGNKVSGDRGQMAVSLIRGSLRVSSAISSCTTVPY